MRPYILKRSRRKTIAIHITPEGVEVRAPLRASATAIEDFIRQKELWIEQKLKMLPPQPAPLAETRALPYLGRQYPLRFEPGAAGFNGSVFVLPTGRDEEVYRKLLIQIYQKLTLPLVQDRTEYFANRLNVKPTSVTVTAARKRWGSCTAGQRLHFSWMLGMTPPDCVDYVVVHELAHLRQMNHSPAFWAIVQGILPQYRQVQKLLRTYERMLP